MKSLAHSISRRLDLAENEIMKRVEGVVYLYCCEKWHERWNDKLMTRWMPRHLFLTERNLACILCEETRR